MSYGFIALGLLGLHKGPEEIFALPYQRLLRHGESTYALVLKTTVFRRDMTLVWKGITTLYAARLCLLIIMVHSRKSALVKLEFWVFNCL